MKSFNSKNKYGPALSEANGFTLIEFMVVIGIFIVFSGIMLARYSTLKSSTSVENLAQDMAITIRKAQLYSVGVKGVMDISSKEIFPPGYGISFSSSNTKSYVLFADLAVGIGASGNKIYDSAGSGSGCGSSSLIFGNECLDTVSINSYDTIDKLYVDATVCSGNLDIVFTRPNLGASIKCGSTVGSKAQIEVKSSNGKIKTIYVESAGNMGVK